MKKGKNKRAELKKAASENKSKLGDGNRQEDESDKEIREFERKQLLLDLSSSWLIDRINDVHSFHLIGHLI